jgi:hypothetical protein
MQFGHDHVGRAIIVEQHAPPAAARPAGLLDVQEQRIDPGPRGADVINRAAAGAEAVPGAQPLVTGLEALKGAAGLQDRNDQKRRGSPAGRGRGAEQLAGAGAIEQDAEPGDVAGGPDLLVLDHDGGDHGVEDAVRKAGGAGDRLARGLGPEHLPALGLGLPPAVQPRFLGGLAGDVDLDAGDLQRAGAVDGRDAAIAAFKLREQGGTASERGEESQR